MNNVRMRLEYDKIKEEFKDVHEVLDQGDSVVLRFDDEGTEACITDDGVLYFQIPTVVDKVKVGFERRFPIFKDALGEDDDYWVFERFVDDLKLIREILQWLGEKI